MALSRSRTPASRPQGSPVAISAARWIISASTHSLTCAVILCGIQPLLVRLLLVQAQDVAPTTLALAEHDLLGTQPGVDLGVAARMREDLVPDLLHPPDRRGQDIAPGPLGERVEVGLRVQPGVAHEQHPPEPHRAQVRLD